jgi:hypothetical protein
MRKIILIVLGGLVLLVAGFAIVVAMQPSEYTVSRGGTMEAPQADVFNQVNDFHNWKSWSPWAKLDPNMTETFEGAPSGKGAVYKWTGNSDVGEGSMTITESTPSERIKIDLEFIKPFPSKCVTDFFFKAQGNQTIVTWTMTGQNNFVGKAFSLFMNMDKMIGGDFEKGLAQLKEITEAKAKK